MKTVDQPAKTRVFRAGNSQAVRIPKSFELPEGDVYIEKREGGLFISTHRGRWDLFFAQPGVDLPYSAEELRHKGKLTEVDLSVLGASQSSARGARKTTRRRPAPRRSS